MNLEEIIAIIKKESAELYPEMPELPQLCADLITWERSNISVAVPKYKEQYKRWLEERAKEVISRKAE